MAKVRSSVYPELLVHDLGVQFRDGVAEVKDRKVLDVLAGIEGVEVEKAPTAAEKAKAAAEAKAKAEAEEKAAAEAAAQKAAEDEAAAQAAADNPDGDPVNK